MLQRTFSVFVAAVLLAGAAHAALPSPRLKPQPPSPSAFITTSDHMLLKSVAKAVDNKQWTSARNAAWAIKDDNARTLGQWIYLYGRDPKAAFHDIAQFMDANPNWPAPRTLQIHAERRMRPDLESEEILAFFDKREPITGEGKLQLARAMFAAGATDVGAAWVRRAWIEHDWISTKENEILGNYGSWLRPEDHAQRIDRLLWDRRITAARRIMKRAPSSDQQISQARIKLMTRSSGALSSMRALPASYQEDSGLLYEAARYLRRGNTPKNNTAAIEMLKRGSANHDVLRRPDKWWTERHLMARRALKEARFQDAYDLAAAHGYLKGSQFAEGEFIAGWTALRFLNEPEIAATHFARLAGGVSTPISRSRGHYWMGRADEVLGSPDADAQYRKAASFPYTYYGQLAAERVTTPEVSLHLPQSPFIAPDAEAAFNDIPVVRAAHLLGEMGDIRRFRIMLRHLDDVVTTPDQFALLARLGKYYAVPDASVRVAKTALRQNIVMADYSYPTQFLPETRRMFAEGALVLGLSRQESEFNPRAYSRAGARGLMQLMPETARITARKEGLQYQRSWLMNDPLYNVTLGSAHLSHLLKRFDNSYIMTIAAYNAGAGRVDRWVRDYGDPRRANVDPIDWVELIPFSETRNYVQRVLENTTVYRSQISGAPLQWRLTADLARGGVLKTDPVSPPSPILASLAAARAGLPAPKATAPKPVMTARPAPAPAPVKPVAPIPQPQPPAQPKPVAKAKPLPAAPTAPGPAKPKSIPEGEVFAGAIQSDECELFIPDSTGGGTCAVFAPAAPAPQPTSSTPQQQPSVQDLNEAALAALAAPALEETPSQEAPAADPLVALPQTGDTLEAKADVMQNTPMLETPTATAPDVQETATAQVAAAAQAEKPACKPEASEPTPQRAQDLNAQMLQSLIKPAAEEDCVPQGKEPAAGS